MRVATASVVVALVVAAAVACTPGEPGSCTRDADCGPDFVCNAVVPGDDVRECVTPECRTTPSCQVAAAAAGFCTRTGDQASCDPPLRCVRTGDELSPELICVSPETADAPCATLPGAQGVPLVEVTTPDESGDDVTFCGDANVFCTTDHTCNDPGE
jgi:hypothetical protein